MKRISIVLLLLLPVFISGQTLESVFRSINVDQGHINDIMRDSEGFIWVSTQDGLSKFNGAQWNQYNYNRSDSTSISHNYVWTTFEDSKGNIWVGTFGGGLCRYDKARNRFYRYDKYWETSQHGIRQFDQRNDSTLLVGTDKGLHLFNLNTLAYFQDTSFIQLQFDKGLFHTHSMEVVNEDIIVAGENGGYILSTSPPKVIKINARALGLDKIGYIKKMPEHTFVMAGPNAILKVAYQSANKTFELLNKIDTDFARGIHEVVWNENNHLLIASEDGLFVGDFFQGTISAIPHDQPEKNNLSDKVIYCIEEIEKDIKWIGSKTHIYEYTNKKSAFRSILSDQLCNSAILGMVEDDRGNLWVATRRGLGRVKGFDLPMDQWQFYCYNQESHPEMRNAYLLNVAYHNNELLIGFRRTGFNYARLSDDDQLVFNDPPSVVDDITKSGSVSNFLIDSKDNLWIATSGNGVIKWNQRNKNKYTQYRNVDGHPKVLSHNYTFGFEEVDSNWVAVATASGISMIHQQIDSLYFIIGSKDSLSLNGNFVMDFHRDAQGKLWVCTDGGINLWEDQNRFRSWTKNEGLPNEVIYGMVSTDDQSWVSTNRGLVQIIMDGRTPDFKNYTKEDGVVNEEHNQFSYYKSKQGDLLFGGKEGISILNPSDLKDNAISAIPVLASFRLLNKNADDKFEKHINYMDEIHLDHDENFFSFDLSSISYYKPDQNQYRYKLLPLNTEWIALGKRNYISFNGLAPGNYTLQLQSSNNDGIFGSKIKTLQIIIRKPWYNRWYAWLIYCTVISGIAYAFYKMRVNHITKLAEVREEERTAIRERSARDFHDEVGSLITKLSLLNQYALSNTPVSQVENIDVLNKMQHNIQKVRSGMKDFIWVLDPRKDQLGATIIKIKEMGNDLFEHSATHFACEVEEGLPLTIELNAIQRRQLILLLKEAMHNVIKHAEAQNCVVKVSKEKEGLIVAISDDGKGYDPTSRAEGYGTKSIMERARKMNGILKVNSVLDQGTWLTISFLPTHLG